MDAWRALFTTDAGLLSLGGILFMLGMAGFLFWKFKKLMDASSPDDK
jgi:LPXTG-motif cell wall-anchored protein